MIKIPIYNKIAKAIIFSVGYASALKLGPKV